VTNGTTGEIEIAKCVERGGAVGEPTKIVAAARLTSSAGCRRLWAANVKPMAEPGRNGMTSGKNRSARMLAEREPQHA
jgi:hypothetical protein